MGGNGKDENREFELFDWEWDQSLETLIMVGLKGLGWLIMYGMVCEKKRQGLKLRIGVWYSMNVCKGKKREVNVSDLLWLYDKLRIFVCINDYNWFSNYFAIKMVKMVAVLLWERITAK